MTRPPDGRDGSTGNSSGRGFLTPAVRRDISDLNRQFLSLALEPALVGDVRFALPEEVRPLLTAGGDGLLARVAACPFTLFQVSLAHGRPGALGSGVEDNRRPLVDAATAARAQSFAHVAVFLAWRLADTEPLAFRMAMLGKDPRLAECLQRAARLANWDGGEEGTGQGIACHVIQEGRIAVVATARRDALGVRVDRICAVADIGRIVNLNVARQQIEGGLVFGLGLALGASTDYAEGLPTNGRLSTLTLPRLADCPSIEVGFVDSDAAPADPGELGVAAVAPAIANALFSATGVRFRKLPLLSEDV